MKPRGEPAHQHTASLHNRFEGHSGAWQLTESVDNFLTRLPPASTDRGLTGLTWIRIANPFIENAAEGENHQEFIQGGLARLKILSSFIRMSNTSGKPRFVVKREISEARKATVNDLHELSIRCGLVSGKWMLFPEPGTVNNVWSKVARATANNELGISAKVAARDESEGEHLVCIYTSDFRDKDDIARVLSRLRQLDLVRQGGKQIYYKCGGYTYMVQATVDAPLTKRADSWTSIGIYGENEWNIPASMVRPM